MTKTHFPGQIGFYKGKVRDIYTIRDKLIVMIVSDRLSAFDVILPKPIPNKGQVLNQIAAFMLEATRDICPNWLLSTPTPNTSLGFLCKPIKLEIVVRGYLTGHAWRTYSSGKRKLCGVILPENMKENEKFPIPIITPSTKSDIGHDEDIGRNEIIYRGIIDTASYQKIENYALALYDRGCEIAFRRGLILVDTKYEFGMIDGEIYLMDEIHTPDSSRYFYAEGFEEKIEKNEKPEQLSKEFVREWLIENNFMGNTGQIIPVMNDEWIAIIRERYINLYEKLIGENFIAVNTEKDELYEKVSQAIQSITLNTK